MKKVLPVIACVVALMLALPTLAFAGPGYGHHGWRNGGNGQGISQGAGVGQQGHCGRGYCQNGGYVDNNNDGICDNCAQNGLNCWQCVDEDGDGFCDQHHGACFMDTDGDGLCDHRQGRNFVDADGDGVCDHQPGHACVDEDNDGICDYMQESACPLNGNNCAQFIDEDNDGICDYHHNGAHCNNYQSQNNVSNQRQGSGHHQGYGHGCRR